MLNVSSLEAASDGDSHLGGQRPRRERSNISCSGGGSSSSSSSSCRSSLNLSGNPFDLSFVGLYSAISEKVFHDSLKPEARHDKVFSACVKNHIA